MRTVAFEAFVPKTLVLTAVYGDGVGGGEEGKKIILGLMPVISLIFSWYEQM